MRKQMNLESMEDLEKAAQRQGISFEEFKQNMRNQIITQQVIGKEVGSKMAITKEEDKKFYDEHKANMERPEQIRLSEILVSTDTEEATADTLATDEAPSLRCSSQSRRPSGPDSQRGSV